MKSSAIAAEETHAASNSNALRPALIWLYPLLYPLWNAAIVHSVELMRTCAMIRGLLVTVAMSWALGGPLVAWLTLDYLDRNALDRRQYRAAVYGALLAAASPPLYILLGAFLGQVHHVELRSPVWYFVNALVAGAIFLPASEAKIAPVEFRRVHGYSAVLIVLFALAHLSNHIVAVVSLHTNEAVMRALRLFYRERLIEIGLVGAVVTQALTGFTMVWKSRFRRTTTFRNLQTVSGMYLAAFFLSHLFATLAARYRMVDTTFAWATKAPGGLIASVTTVGLLPYYILAVVMLFAHLACQARRNLARIMSDAAARQISYSAMAIGGIVAFVIALAACGIHLRS